MARRRCSPRRAASLHADHDDADDAVSDWLARFAAPAFPWHAAAVAEIEARRARMADLLLFDVLLLRGGVREPDLCFPPVDPPALRSLLRAIAGSTYDRLKKDCLVYILLKWHGDARETRFQEDRCIPPQFAALADAYWFLDAGLHLSKAVSLLADARLNRDYVSKILQALALADDPPPLIVAYVRTAKPLLVEPDDIDLYTLALAQAAGFMDAWQFQRSFPESSPTRARLFHKLLDWALAPNPRPAPLAQLIGYSLTAFEQSLLTAYALHPPPSLPPHAVAAVQDLVCMRLVQCADHVGAIKLDRQLAAPSAKERRQLMDDILATLPPAERWALEADLGQLTTGVRIPAARNPPNGTRHSGRLSGDADMSWDEISTPRPSATLASVARPSDAPLSSQNLFASPASTANKSSPFAVLAPRRSQVGASGIPLTVTRTIAAPSPPLPSIFGRSGSAKHAPNAFYKPPQSQVRTSTGTQNTAMPAASTNDVPEAEQHTDDEDAGEFLTHDKEMDTSDIMVDAEDVPELPYSVFGGSVAPVGPPSSKHERRRSGASTPSSSVRELRQPPGAFYDAENANEGEGDGEGEGEEDEDSDGRRATVSPSASASASASASRSRSVSMSPKTTRTQRASLARAPAVGHVRTRSHTRIEAVSRLPGSLMDDDDEADEMDVVADEGVDDVMPLPPVQPVLSRGGRKRRSGVSKTTAKSQSQPQSQSQSKTLQTQGTPPRRRSSRLSTASASSDGLEMSSPPPPMPPQNSTGMARTRKSARVSAVASVGTGGTTRSGTRRKR